MQKLIADLPLPTFADRLDDNYFATGAVRLRPAQDRREGQPQRDHQADSLRPPRLAEPRLRQPADVRRSRRPAGQHAGGQGGQRPRQHVHDHRQRELSLARRTSSSTATPAITLIKVAVRAVPAWTRTSASTSSASPAPTAPSRLYGGWPQFAVTSFSHDRLRGQRALPYVDDNWQYQYTANATWTQGRAHVPVRRRHRAAGAEPASRPARGSGSFTFGGGPTTIRGGPSANTFNNFATFLLGLPTHDREEHHPVRGQPHAQPQLAVQHFREGSVAGWSELTASLGVRWDYFPMGTRTTRGLERYDFENNQMLICGDGIDSDRLRLRHGQGQLLAAPRPGLSRDRHAGHSRRLRHQLRSVSARVRARHPRQLSLVDQSDRHVAERLPVRGPARRRHSGDRGARRQQRRHSRSGQRSARALDPKPKRGYIQSCNVTVQKELPWGFTGQAGYVGTRQRDINQILNLNAGQVPGLGNAGRPFFATFRPHRRNGPADQRRLERLRLAADVAAAPARAGRAR